LGEATHSTQPSHPPIVKNIVSPYSPLPVPHLPSYLSFQKFTYPHHQPNIIQPHPIHPITQIIHTPITQPHHASTQHHNPQSPILSTFLSTTQSPYLPLSKTINRTIQLTKLSTANTPTNPTLPQQTKKTRFSPSQHPSYYTHHTHFKHVSYTSLAYPTTI